MWLNRKAILATILIITSLLVVFPVEIAKAQTATIVVSPSSNTVTVGQTLTIHIEIGNIQNLYAVDIAMTWDTSMLKLDSNQSFVGVSNGVLNTPIDVVQDTASQSIGEYNLIATSENPAGPWSGSATIATLTFTVTSTGTSSLTLESSQSKTPELASYVAPGSGTSQEIPVTVTNGVVMTASSSSSPSASPSPTAITSSPSSSSTASPTPTPKVPEFTMFAVLPLLVLIPFMLLMPRVRKHILRKPKLTW